MKRALLAFAMVAAMLVVVSSARAQSGVNLSWTNCAALGGLQNRTFACTANVGNHVLAASFVLPADVARVAGDVVVMDLISQSSPLPPWWNMVFAGACRPSSLSIQTYDGVDGTTCGDWAQNQASMNIASYEVNPAQPGVGPNTARIKQLNAVQQASEQDLVANHEYGVFKLTMNSQLSVGSPSCAGCADPVCIVLNSVEVDTETGVGNTFLLTGTSVGSNIVTWQGAGANCQAVPVRNSSWGQVKALYR